MLYKRSVLRNVSKFTDKHKKQSSGGVLSKEKMFLKSFAKFTEKHLFRSLFFNKVAGWKPENFRSSHWRRSAKQGALEGVLSSLRQSLVNESPLQIMKNAFYFTKLFLFSRYLNFNLDFSVM